MDGRLTRFSPLPSFAVAAAFAAAWGMLLILVNIGSGGHSPSSAAKISSCCWQRSMSMSRLDSAGGQLEEHESSWAELGMTRVIVVCNGGCGRVAVGISFVRKQLTLGPLAVSTPKRAHPADAMLC